MELRGGAGGVGVVARGENFAGNLVDEFCGGLGAGKVGAIGDVARADEDGVACRRV